MTLKSTDKQRGGVTGRGFLPGQSGNPGGRRPGERQLLEKMYGADGQSVYLRLEALRNHRRTPAKLKKEIDCFIIERLHGRPRQHVDVDATGDLLAMVLAAAVAVDGDRA
jgi:hypothetical protein